jgi:histidyl-tRNA synthetase
VFEIEPQEKGGQSTLGGGGRYDDLVEALGGRPTPAVGFAAGLERIIFKLKGQELAIPSLPQPVAFVAYLGEEAKIEAVKIASELRKADLAVVMGTGDKSLKAQMRQANSSGSTYTLILGEQEIGNRNVLLRDMRSGQQQTLPLAEIVTALKP